jgi:ATP-dependent Clp endopeptidase proteolytic subunit ClpP
MNAFLTIENRKGKLALNSPVHKESADELIQELGRLYGPAAVAANMRIGEIVCAADDALESIEVEINSPGGSVFEGQRIFNALREMSSRGVEIIATVSGIAASMGSVILMAGDKRRMTKGSRVMIHEASTMAYGDAREMRKNADLLEGISAEIAEIYANRTGGDKDEIRNLMFAETWMDAEKAKSLGFIDEILTFKKDKSAAAEFDTTTKPMSILAKLFPGNDQVAELEAQIVENETLRAELTDAQAKITELSGYSEIIAQKDVEISDISARLATADTLANAQAQTIADLTEKAETTDEKVSLKAAELLAATGHPTPVDLAAPNATDPVALYLAAVESGDTKLRSEIFAKHKDAIMAHRAKLNK